MARTFLTNLNLEQNQLLKAVIQNATEDPGSGVAGQVYYNTATDVLKVYSGSASAWVAVGSVEFIGDSVADLLQAGTGISLNYDDANDTLTITNEGILDVSTSTLSILNTSGSVSVDLVATNPTGSGTGEYDSLEHVLTIPVVNVDSYGLVTSIDSASATIVTSVAGTENEIEVSASHGAVTIGLPDDVTIGGSLTITGDLTVNGDTTTLNTQTLEVEDNKVVLNSNVTGSPSIDAGIEVERGDAPNAELFWDESEGKWTSSNGSATYALSLEGHTHVSTDITDFNTAVDSEIDSYLVGSNSISIVSGSIDTTLAASASYLTNANGLAVDKSALESALIVDSFTRKYTEVIGNTASVSYTVTHNLATRNVQVQVYGTENSSYAYETVEVNVDRIDANNVAIGFATPPGDNTFSVVVIG